MRSQRCKALGQWGWAFPSLFYLFTTWVGEFAWPLSPADFSKMPVNTDVGSSAQRSPEVPAAIVTSVGWPSSRLTLPPGLPLFPQLPSMKDNYLFLKEVKNLVEKTNCELKVCFQYINRGDRWIQVRNPILKCSVLIFHLEKFSHLPLRSNLFLFSSPLLLPHIRNVHLAFVI